MCVHGRAGDEAGGAGDDEKIQPATTAREAKVCGPEFLVARFLKLMALACSRPALCISLYVLNAATFWVVPHSRLWLPASCISIQQ